MAARRPRASRRARPRRARRCGRRAARRRARTRTRDGTTESCSSASRQAGPRRPHAGEHRLDDRGGDDVGRGGQHLGDEERVAAGDAVHGAGVGAGARGQAPHRRARQRRQRQPAHRAPGQGAQQALQRMRRAELVVAEGQDEHRGHRLDPPRQVAEHVERRVVGPVDVLDDERRRRRGRELGQDRGVDVVDRPAVGERRLERSRRTPARRRAAGRAPAAPSGRRTPTAAPAPGRPPLARRRGPRWSCRSRRRR